MASENEEGRSARVERQDSRASTPPHSTHTHTHPFLKCAHFCVFSIMLHPLIIGIMAVNTTLTVIYWTFLLGDVYFKWMMEPEDKPKKVVTPA